MPSTTWMQRAVASEARRARVTLWRAVEAQHIASTARITRSAPDQLLLEQLLDESKPAIPAAARALHYLLYTPFRYPSPSGSRFRASTDPGVWYGSESKGGACAEVGYWRWRFLLDSEGLDEIPATPQTLFRARAAGKAINLGVGTFTKHVRAFEDPGSYVESQALARVCRDHNVALIRYRSVRDPDRAPCAAVTTPVAFVEAAPDQRETWLLAVFADRVIWQCGSDRIELDCRASGWMGND